MNIAVSPEAIKQHEAHKAVRARLRANPWKPKLIEAGPQLEASQEGERKRVIVSVEHDWVKKWKAREAEDMKNAVPRSAPTVRSIQYFCLRQEWQVDGLTIFPNDVSFNEMISPRRIRRINHMRFMAVYVAKKLTSRSNKEIGKLFGNRDHTSILHAVKRVDEMVREDRVFMNGKPFSLERIGEI